MIGFLVALFAIVVSVCIVVAMVTAQARLLNQCLGISILVGIILLVFPGLNLVGLCLLAVAGLMILLGKCKLCENTPEPSALIET